MLNLSISIFTIFSSLTVSLFMKNEYFRAGLTVVTCIELDSYSHFKFSCTKLILGTSICSHQGGDLPRSLIELKYNVVPFYSLLRSILYFYGIPTAGRFSPSSVFTSSS